MCSENTTRYNLFQNGLHSGNYLMFWWWTDRKTSTVFGRLPKQSYLIFHESLWGLWCSADDEDDDEEEEDLVKAFCPKVSVRQYNLCPDTCPVWQQHLIIRARLSSFENHNEGDYWFNHNMTAWSERGLFVIPCNLFAKQILSTFSVKNLCCPNFFSAHYWLSVGHMALAPWWGMKDKGPQAWSQAPRRPIDF